MGGVILSAQSSVYIISCSIKGNNAFHGGAFVAVTSSFNIINSSINSNNAINKGGLIYFDSEIVAITNIHSLNLINSTFTGNCAHYGGVIYAVLLSFSITNSTFSINSGIYGGGVINAVNSSFNIVDSRFINNSCSGMMYNDLEVYPYGGIVYTRNSSFDIINTYFNNNTAVTHGYGGILLAISCMFSFIGNTVINSRADWGGAVAAFTKSSFNITNCTFKWNSGQYGAVLFLYKSFFNANTSIFCTNTGTYGVVNTSTLDISDTDIFGGVVLTFYSSFSLINNTMSNNSADNGIISTLDSTFHITSSIFTSNKCTLREGYGAAVFMIRFPRISNISYNTSKMSDNYRGGVIFVQRGSVNISNSKFIKNSAGRGGVMSVRQSSVGIVNCTMNDNNAYVYGGAIDATGSSFSIINSTFDNNSAYFGGVIDMEKSLFNIIHCTFTNNSTTSERVPHAFINNSTYTSNSTLYSGGVISAKSSSSNIVNSTFIMNTADHAGVIINLEQYNCSLNFTNCIFTNNSAGDCAVLILQYNANVTISSSTFTHNTANYSTVISITSGHIAVANSTFRNNVVEYMKTVSITDSSMYITDCTFEHNVGSLYALSANVIFTGYVKFANCTEPTRNTAEGGAISSYQSSLLFTGVIQLLSNQASRGGALLVFGSTITVSGQVMVANNTAINSNGGGIKLYQSELKVFGNFHISHNHAMKGGGIHASSSPISVYQPGLLQFSGNYAEIAGGGLHLEMNPRLNLLKRNNSASILFIFRDNHATYGGAVYVADNTSFNCLYGVECFIQAVALYDTIKVTATGFQFSLVTMNFSDNTATNSGPNLFGGFWTDASQVYLQKPTKCACICTVGPNCNITGELLILEISATS